MPSRPYERSLVTPGSRFDRWLGGEAAALSPEEQKGISAIQVDRLHILFIRVSMSGGKPVSSDTAIFHPLASPETRDPAGAEPA